MTNINSFEESVVKFKGHMLADFLQMQNADNKLLEL